jgi:glycosyltransferase involved in cell wall biosynthesis
MILNCMLGSDYGGLEKLFLDEIEMLPLANLPARGLVCRGSKLANYARDRHLAFDEIWVWSDWDPISVARARSIVRRHAPQIVICVGRRAHRLLGRAIGTTIPIVPMVQKRRFDPDVPHAGVMVAAEHRRRSLIEDGVRPKDIIVIPNAVRLPAQPNKDYGLSAGQPVRIAALGRLHEKKGFGVLIQAIGSLNRHGIDCSCVIAGEGPERRKLEGAIRDESVAAKVTLPGWTNDVADFLSGADLFVLPSFQEDFPLAVLDAMASGMPIVSSAIDGPKDFLVDTQTALLVPPDDPAALANALRRLIEDGALRERLGRNARAAAEQNYSFEAVARQLGSAMRNVLDGRPISSGAA